MGRKKGEKPTVRGSVATKADKVGAVAGQAAAQTNIETTLKEMGIISITRTVKKKKQATIITVPAIAQDRETKQILEERYGDFLAKKGQKYTKLTIASLLHEFNIKINGAKSIVNGVVRGSALSRNHEEINLLFKLILSSSSVNLAAEQSHGIMRNLALYLQDPLFTQIPINTLINGYLNPYSKGIRESEKDKVRLALDTLLLISESPFAEIVFQGNKSAGEKIKEEARKSGTSIPIKNNFELFEMLLAKALNLGDVNEIKRVIASYYLNVYQNSPRKTRDQEFKRFIAGTNKESNNITLIADARKMPDGLEFMLDLSKKLGIDIDLSGTNEVTALHCMLFSLKKIYESSVAAQVSSGGLGNEDYPNLLKIIVDRTKVIIEKGSDPSKIKRDHEVLHVNQEDLDRLNEIKELDSKAAVKNLVDSIEELDLAQDGLSRKVAKYIFDDSKNTSTSPPRGSSLDEQILHFVSDSRPGAFYGYLKDLNIYDGGDISTYEGKVSVIRRNILKFLLIAKELCDDETEINRLIERTFSQDEIESIDLSDLDNLSVTNGGDAWHLAASNIMTQTTSLVQRLGNEIPDNLNKIFDATRESLSYLNGAACTLTAPLLLNNRLCNIETILDLRSKDGAEMIYSALYRAMKYYLETTTYDNFNRSQLSILTYICITITEEREAKDGHENKNAKFNEVFEKYHKKLERAVKRSYGFQEEKIGEKIEEDEFTANNIPLADLLFSQLLGKAFSLNEDRLIHKHVKAINRAILTKDPDRVHELLLMPITGKISIAQEMQIILFAAENALLKQGESVSCDKKLARILSRLIDRLGPCDDQKAEHLIKEIFDFKDNDGTLKIQETFLLVTMGYISTEQLTDYLIKNQTDLIKKDAAELEKYKKDHEDRGDESELKRPIKFIDSILEILIQQESSFTLKPKEEYGENLIQAAEENGIQIGSEKELEHPCKFASNIKELSDIIKNHENGEDQAIIDVAKSFLENRHIGQSLLRLKIDDEELFNKVSKEYSKLSEKDLEETFFDIAKTMLSYLCDIIPLHVAFNEDNGIKNLIKIAVDLYGVASEENYLDFYRKILDLSLQINTYFEAPLVNFTINSLVDGLELIAGKCPNIKTLEGDKVRFATNLMSVRPVLADSVIFAIKKLKIDPFAKNIEENSTFDEFLNIEVDFLDVEQRFKLLDYFLGHPNFENQNLSQENKDKVINLVISYGGDKAPEMINGLARINCKLPRPDFTTDVMCPVKSVLLNANNIVSGNYNLINTALENSEGFPFDLGEVLSFFKRRSFYAGSDLRILSKISSGQKLTLKTEQNEIVFQRKDYRDRVIQGETKKLASNISEVAAQIERLEQEIQKEEDSKKVFSKNDLNELEVRLGAEFAAQKKEIEGELSELNIDNLNLEEEIGVLKANLVDGAKKYLEADGKVSGRDVRITELEARITELEAQIAELEGKISGKDVRITELETQNQKLSDQYKGLGKELKELQGKYDDTLEENAASHYSEMQELANDKFAAEDAQTISEGELKAAQEDLGSMQEKLEGKNTEIAELKPKIITLETENKRLEGEKTLIDQANEALSQRVSELEGMNAGIPEAVTVDHESEYEAKITELQREVTEFKKQNGTLRKELGFAERDRDTSRAREEGLQEALQQYQYAQGGSYYPGAVYQQPTGYHPATGYQQQPMGYGSEYPRQPYRNSQSPHGTVSYVPLGHLEHDSIHPGQAAEAVPGTGNAKNETSEAMTTPPQSTPPIVKERTRTPSPDPGAANGEGIDGGDRDLGKQ